MKKSSSEKHIKTLYSNKWLSLKSIKKPCFGPSEYIFSHETRCNGKILSILPFRRNRKGIVSEFLVRSEVTPCWGRNPWMSSITGGIEGDTIKHALIELKEEAGYIAKKKDIILVGFSFGAKSSDTVYTLLSVDLTNIKKSCEPKGDGSFMETQARCQWVDENQLEKAVDPLIFANWYKLMGYLSIKQLIIKKTK